MVDIQAFQLLFCTGVSALNVFYDEAIFIQVKQPPVSALEGGQESLSRSSSVCLSLCGLSNIWWSRAISRSNVGEFERHTRTGRDPVPSHGPRIITRGPPPSRFLRMELLELELVMVSRIAK